MSTLQSIENERGLLNEALEDLSNITPEMLVRREELGEDLNFQEGVPFFTRTLSLFKELQDCRLDNVSYSALHQLRNAAEDAVSNFQSIRSFSLKSSDSPRQIRQQFIDRIRDSYDHLYSTITPQIAYAMRRSSKLQTAEEDARVMLDEISEIRNGMFENKDKLEEEAKEILETLRKAAGQSGVSKHDIHFAKEADYQESQSRFWLAMTIILVFAALALAIYSVLYYSKQTVSTPLDITIQLVVAKIIAFSVLSYGIVLTGKIYRAHRHNLVVNRHRQHALSTFEAFVKAAGSDVDTKNAVLLRATEAIFSPSSSGYVEDGKGEQFGPQIIEVLRSIGPTVKPPS